ncbi:hypothetical protein Avbf_05442 [Armadillidium vulgare]|nr:hypothetical protein Avbf_05442 [Armadillidium vulgare]
MSLFFHTSCFPVLNRPHELPNQISIQQIPLCKSISTSATFTSNGISTQSGMLNSSSKLIRVGHHTFNFRYRLPQNIPPSYESQWGFVRHYAEVVLETRSLLKRNFKCSEMITVASSGWDLRKYPDAVKKSITKHN